MLMINQEDTSILSSVDDLFIRNDADVSATVAAEKKPSRDAVISPKEYKDWFDSRKSFYNAMLQFSISCTSDMCDNIPEYIYELCERVHYCLSMKRSLFVSDIHVSSDRARGHINVCFWVSYNENVRVFLNLYCMLYKIHEAFCRITRDDVYNRSVYGVRVSFYRADGYERSLQSLSDGYTVLKGAAMTDAWNLRFNPEFNVGFEKDAIEEICRELTAKYIFLVRGQWTLTWQTLHYFWTKLRKHPNRNLPDDWYEKTRDEMWLSGNFA